jgi:hypothetical protein
MRTIPTNMALPASFNKTLIYQVHAISPREMAV